VEAAAWSATAVRGRLVQPQALAQDGVDLSAEGVALLAGHPTLG
jgi:hypothetical protein